MPSPTSSMPMKQHKPFIAITQRIIENQEYYEQRECLALDWGEFFARYFKGEFLPLPLSYGLDFSAYMPYVCGVILSGGNDLAMLNPNPISQKRDIYESKILEHCKQHKIPLLGVCRGAQMLAHCFGAQIIPCVNHIGTHEVYTDDTSFCVNSFHNYCIARLTDELEALALAEDSSIEAFRHRILPFYGIVWHIERENGLNDDSVLTKWIESIYHYQGV